MNFEAYSVGATSGLEGSACELCGEPGRAGDSFGVTALKRGGVERVKREPSFRGSRLGAFEAGSSGLLVLGRSRSRTLKVCSACCHGDRAPTGTPRWLCPVPPPARLRHPRVTQCALSPQPSRQLLLHGAHAYSPCPV